MLLKDKTILVTGAGRGMGRGIAQAVAEAGANVVAADLQIEPVNETARLLENAGHRCLPLVADVTDEASVSQAVAKTVETFGAIDGLVNNAGVVISASILDSRPQDRALQFAVNVEGVFLCSQAVARWMIENKRGGSIVNIASEAGKVGHPLTAPYNATKAAVINLTRTCALEWWQQGINVNAVCPGGVDTPMLREVAEKRAPEIGMDVDELYAQMTPPLMDRHIQPVEIGRVVAFLLSDQAVIIRGQSINTDGGGTPY